MGKENVYLICKECIHTCTNKPCEAILALKTLQAADELGLDEIRYNLDLWLQKDS